MPKYTMHCSECDGQNVVADAYASWNVDTQQHEVDNVFDKGAYCDDCESSEIRIHEREIPESPGKKTLTTLFMIGSKHG